MQWATGTPSTLTPKLLVHAVSHWDSIHSDTWTFRPCSELIGLHPFCHLNFQPMPRANGTPSTFPWTFSPCHGPMGLHQLCHFNFLFMLWVDGAPLSCLNFQSMQWATWTPHHHLTFQSMHIHTKLLHRQHSRSIRITAMLAVSASFSPHPEKCTHFQSNPRAHPPFFSPPLPHPTHREQWHLYSEPAQVSVILYVSQQWHLYSEPAQVSVILFVSHLFSFFTHGLISNTQNWTKQVSHMKKYSICVVYHTLNHCLF